MKAGAIALLVLASALATFAACSEESGTDDDDVTTTTGTATGAGTGSGTGTGTGSGTGTGTGSGTGTGTGTGSGTGGSSGVSIDVTQGNVTQTVDLGTLTPFTCGTAQCVAVDDIILGGFPSVTIASIQADFVAGDGFTPSSSPNCQTLVPVPGANLDKGRVSLDSRNLMWDASLNYPGCLEVNDLATIIISTP